MTMKMASVLSFASRQAQSTRQRLCSWRPWRHSNAKWWYSTVHLTVAIIGAGVVGLPRAMQHLGWWPGMLMLGANWIITACTTWLVIQLHELPGHDPVDRYADLGRLLGVRGGRTFMLLLSIVAEVTANIAYMVTGGLVLKILFDSDKDYLWILIFGMCQALLSLFASFASLTIVNLIGTLTAIGYSTIMWTSARAVSPPHHPAALYDAGSNFFKQANAVGVIAFALGGQIIQLEIQATMVSTNQRPSKHPMWNGVVASYIIIAACYFPVAAVGYKIFKHHCFNNFFEIVLEESRLQHKDTVRRVVRSALVMLATHLLGSYQIYALPIYGLLERLCPRRVPPMLVRPAYVGLTCFVAILFPSFNGILGIIGGLALAPSSYIMPCVIWMKLRRPRLFSPAWIANMVVIGFGATLMVVAVVGGFRTLVKHRLFHFPNDCNTTLPPAPQPSQN